MSLAFSSIFSHLLCLFFNLGRLFFAPWVCPLNLGCLFSNLGIPWCVRLKSDLSPLLVSLFQPSPLEPGLCLFPPGVSRFSPVFCLVLFSALVGESPLLQPCLNLDMAFGCHPCNLNRRRAKFKKHVSKSKESRRAGFRHLVMSFPAPMQAHFHEARLKTWKRRCLSLG